MKSQIFNDLFIYNLPKMLRFLLLGFLSVILLSAGFSQDNLTYQTPSADLALLVDAPATPAVIQSPDNQYLAILNRKNYLTIADLARPELRIAGLRIDPSNNGPSRLKYQVDLAVMNIRDKKVHKVSGLPEHVKIIN